MMIKKNLDNNNDPTISIIILIMIRIDQKIIMKILA